MKVQKQRGFFFKVKKIIYPNHLKCEQFIFYGHSSFEDNNCFNIFNLNSGQETDIKGSFFSI